LCLRPASIRQARCLRHQATVARLDDHLGAPQAVEAAVGVVKGVLLPYP
jgi:hypothetical protein